MLYDLWMPGKALVHDPDDRAIVVWVMDQCFTWHPERAFAPIAPTIGRVSLLVFRFCFHFLLYLSPIRVSHFVFLVFFQSMPALRGDRTRSINLTHMGAVSLLCV